MAVVVSEGGGGRELHTCLSVSQGWEVGEVVAVVVSEGGGGRELHIRLSISQGWEVGEVCGCGGFRRGRREVVAHTSVHHSRVGGRRSCGCGGFRRGRREELHICLSVSQAGR